MSANLAANLTATAERTPDAIAMKLDDLELTLRAARRAQRARVAGLLRRASASARATASA